MPASQSVFVSRVCEEFLHSHNLEIVHLRFESLQPRIVDFLVRANIAASLVGGASDASPSRNRTDDILKSDLVDKGLGCRL